MRFIPINLDNVKNAAMLYLDIFTKDPWNLEWTYSTAYARLSAEVKKVGFTGYIVLNENGLPGGFLMGHTDARADGTYDFHLTDVCFQATMHGNELAFKALEHLTEELKKHNICRMEISMEYSRLAEAFYGMLGFKNKKDVLIMERTI